jgi:hypothetical protein
MKVIMSDCELNEQVNPRDPKEATMDISNLIERTRNWGITKNPDGSTNHKMTLSVEGSVNNCINSQGEDNWGIKELARLYHEGREAWLRGDLETVADLFGILT